MSETAAFPNPQISTRARLPRVRHIARIRSAVVALAVVAAALVPVGATANASDSFTFQGGGWGHGIGMPQWAAQGQAEAGYSWQDILSYWYSDTGLRNAGQITPSVPVDEIRVGINYVDMGSTKENRPFLWLDWRPIGGDVQVCLPGESQGSCTEVAKPGETWRTSWNANQGRCEVRRGGGGNAYQGNSCDIRLYWNDQPNTRINFPGSDVDRTFARGHVAFVGPKTVNGQTGFHLNIVLSLDEYVYGIAEVPPSWHMEALKAQAVAARTYGAWKASNGLRSDCSCHVVWDTWDQAYRGWGTLTEGNQNHGNRWRNAVNQTSNQVVVYPAGSNTIAQTYYSSSTGGATENVWEVWASSQSQYPYLKSRPDPWSAQYDGYGTKWSRTLSNNQIVNILGNREPNGSPLKNLTSVTSITIEAKNTSGSPSRIRITGVSGGTTVSKDYVSRSPGSGQGTIAQLVSWFGLTGHYVASINGATGSSGSSSNATGSGSAGVGVQGASTGMECHGITYDSSNPAHVLYPGNFPINNQGRVVVELNGEPSARVVFWDGKFQGGARINGTKYADIICGSGGNDWINGRGGADIIYGIAGNNTLIGGAGRDLIIGGTGNDFIRGGKGNDEIHAGPGGNNVLRGNQGDDVVYGGSGDDELRGGPGDDRLYGVAGTNYMHGGQGNDYLHAGSGNDNLLIGGPGRDELDGGTGNNNVLRGSQGHDTLIGGSGTGTRLNGNLGNDTLLPGPGNRHIVNTGPGNNTVKMGGGSDHVVNLGVGNNEVY